MLRALSVLTVSLALFACGGRLVPLTPQRAVLLATSFEEEAVRAALIRALDARQYVAELEEPGRIVARYERGGIVLRVEIRYDGHQYEIVYLDSTGLSHQVRPDGQTVISAHYQRYMRGLTDRIDEEIARPEREAREAAERAERDRRDAEQRERDHQLALLEAEARDRDRDREAELERDRLATRRAEAEAEARRPVIAGDGGRSVAGLRFSRDRLASPGYGTVHITGSSRGGMEYDGIAGGSFAARQLRFPGYCRGFYDEAPSHVLEVDAMGYLRIEAASAGDTTLALVSEDGGVWCDDDGAGGLDPRIEGELPPGVYYVWVGSYRRGERAPYRLALYDTGATTTTTGDESMPRREETVTTFCLHLRAMQWLDDMSASLSPTERATLDARATAVCGAGLDVSSEERWDDGSILVSGGSWNYPNGGRYLDGMETTYYPNGSRFLSGDVVYYPNGARMISGSDYYAPNGVRSSESGLLTLVLSRLARERSDYMMGRYRGSEGFWHSLYLAAMVWEASR